MGLSIVVRGELRIDPPLKWSEIRKSRFLRTEEGGTEVTDLVLDVHAARQDTDEGMNTVITCDRAVPWNTSPHDPRNLLENVRGLRAENPGHTVTGELVLYDADFLGDVRRIVSDDVGVREEKARLVWPDGTEAETLN